MSRRSTPRPIASHILDVCSIRCGACGHTAPTERFSKDAQGEQLPLSDYRCPECGQQVRLIATKDEFDSPVVRPTIITDSSRSLK